MQNGCDQFLVILQGQADLQHYAWAYGSNNPANTVFERRQVNSFDYRSMVPSYLSLRLHRHVLESWPRRQICRRQLTAIVTPESKENLLCLLVFCIKGHLGFDPLDSMRLKKGRELTQILVQFVVGALCDERGNQ